MLNRTSEHFEVAWFVSNYIVNVPIDILYMRTIRGLSWEYVWSSMCLTGQDARNYLGALALLFTKNVSFLVQRLGYIGIQKGNFWDLIFFHEWFPLKGLCMLCMSMYKAIVFSDAWSNMSSESSSLSHFITGKMWLWLNKM